MTTPEGSGSKHVIRRRDVLTGAAGAASMLVIRPGTARAAKWPDKPITLVIMYAAGGGTDVVMRLIAKEMASAKGWSIEAINKPGAVGGTATNYVLHQPADDVCRLDGHGRRQVLYGNGLAYEYLRRSSRSRGLALRFRRDLPRRTQTQSFAAGGAETRLPLLDVPLAPAHARF